MPYVSVRCRTFSYAFQHTRTLFSIRANAHTPLPAHTHTGCYGAICGSGIPLASRPRHLVLIPQEGFLFNGTLRENLSYARPGASDDELWEVCRAIGIEEWVRRLPERLDTLVRERGGRFSAGERQLVALARALLADPAVIVLDEATANLDPESEARVERALGTLLEGRTAVVIAHRLRSAEQADRVLMMDRGKVIADGTHAELVALSEAYAELVSVWERGVLR